MRAVAVSPDRRTLELVDHPEPARVSETDVLLEILDVGICGTDREIARFDYGVPPPGEPYLVIGHESLARVVEIGGAVDRVKAGDLVVTMVRRPCGPPACRACLLGRQDFCFSGQFRERGIKELHGFMTERVVDDQRYLHPVPAHLREVGVLVEPLTIAEKALIQVWDVQERLPWTVPGGPDDAASTRRALVLGAGPVGLLGAMALIVRGFETWVYSREPEDGDKARWVASIGARYVSSSRTAVADLTARLGEIDLVYEATGAAGLSFQVLEQLGDNGVFVFTGVPGRKGAIEIDADRLMRNLVLKNQLVFGTVNAGADAFAAAIADLAVFHARWPDPLAALITGRYPPDAYQDLLVGPSSGIKRVISFDRTRVG
jgi:threonine dehydrogenase-like Zn-dependent dehydrogenase